MFVSKKQADERLSSARNLLNEDSASAVEEDLESVRDETTVEVVKEEIFEVPALSQLDALIRGDKLARPAKDPQIRAAQREVARYIGNEPTRTMMHVKALTSADPPEMPMVKRITKELRIKRVKDHVALRTGKVLNKVVAKITQDRIDQITNPLELGRLGRDLATIVERMGPKESASGDGFHLHVYAPEQQSMEAFGAPIVVQKERDDNSSPT